MAIFARSKNSRLDREKNIGNLAQSCLTAASNLLILAVAAVLNCAAANADILDEEALKRNRGSAVVRIENARGEVKGYGVVISNQGHVLTAAHVVQGLTPDGIRGQIWPWRTPNPSVPKLTFIEKNEDKNIDIALLQFQDFSATPPKLATGSDSTAILRMLTGSPGAADKLVCIDVKLSINEKSFLEVRGSINSGASGSPMFDRSGNLVGIVVEGLPGQTTAYVRPVEKLKDWLKGKNVGFEEASAAPVMIGIYFSIPYYASSAATDVKTNVIGPLTAALSKSLKDYLTPEPEVITDSKSIEKWSPVANALFEDITMPRNKRFDNAKEKLLDPEYLAWLRKMGFSQLYMLMVRVEKDEKLSTLKPILLILTQHGDKLEVEDGSDPKTKLKIYPPPDYIPDREPFWSMLNSFAVELLHVIVRQRPGFARNNRVFADCIRFPGLDYTKNDRLYWAPSGLETQLRTIFEANRKQIKVKSASEQACREAVSRNVPRYLWPHHLNEYVVDASISGSAVHWRAGHPWDDEDDHHREELDADAEAKDDFEPTVKALAADIDRKWPQILEKFKGALE